MLDNKGEPQQPILPFIPAVDSPLTSLYLIYIYISLLFQPYYLRMKHNEVLQDSGGLLDLKHFLKTPKC